MIFHCHVDTKKGLRGTAAVNTARESRLATVITAIAAATTFKQATAEFARDLYCEHQAEVASRGLIITSPA